MQNVKRYRDRLRRILQNFPDNSANIPTVIERMDALYTQMLEEELAKGAVRTTKLTRARKPKQ